MERFFVLKYGDYKSVPKLNSMLEAGWHVIQTVSWPDAMLLMIAKQPRRERVEDDDLEFDSEIE